MPAREAFGQQADGQLARRRLDEIDEVRARGKRERRVAVGLLHEAERDDGVHEVGPFAHRILFRDGEVLPVDQLAFEQECRKRRQGALGNCTLVDLFTQDRCSFSWTASHGCGARPDPVEEWTKALKRQDF